MLVVWLVADAVCSLLDLITVGRTLGKYVQRRDLSAERDCTVQVGDYGCSQMLFWCLNEREVAERGDEAKELGRETTGLLCSASTARSKLAMAVSVTGWQPPSQTKVLRWEAGRA